MLPAPYARALRRLLDALRDCDAVWALTGSAGLALQGVAIVPRDIDVQTDKQGAYAIQERLKAYVTRPVAFSATGRIRSHLGALRLAGVPVELMGRLQKRLPDGRWDVPVDVGSLRTVLSWQGYAVPVLPLEYEYQAYLTLGRTETADRIRRVLTARGG
jgi:hypothetical protein